jgi:hypothetical protein
LRWRAHRGARGARGAHIPAFVPLYPHFENCKSLVAATHSIARGLPFSGDQENARPAKALST